jgi:hypothetical protein
MQKKKRGVPYNFSLVAFLERENDSIGLFRMWFDAAALWQVLHMQLADAAILMAVLTHHKILPECLVFWSALLNV